MRQKLFNKLAHLIYNHYGKVLIASFILTLIAIALSSRLTMKTQFVDMLPQHIPQVKEFKSLLDEYNSASTIMIAVENKDTASGTQLMEKCVEEIADKLSTLTLTTPIEAQDLTFTQNMALMSGETNVEGVQYQTRNLVKRIDYQSDNSFIANHGMMMQKKKDLKNFLRMFENLSYPEILEAINNNFEQEYVDDPDNLNSLDGEVQAVNAIDGVYEFVNSLNKYLTTGDTSSIGDAVNQFLTGPKYFYSPDKSTILVILQPAVNLNDYDAMLVLGEQIYDSLDVIKPKYRDLDIHAAGLAVGSIDEMRLMEKDFGLPNIIALLLILVILIGSFKAFKNPFYSVITLIISIIWTAAFIYIIIGNLNQMTAGFAIILIGLGIDFAIHYLSGYRDGLDRGLSIQDALVFMFSKVGNGVITGAMTTSIVFLTLCLTGFDVMIELGLAVGLGIITCMVLITIILPSLIVFDNRTFNNLNTRMSFNNTLIFKPIFDFMQFNFITHLAHAIQKPMVTTFVLIGTAISIIFSLMGAGKIGFEYDMMKQFPEDTPSVMAQNKIIDVFEMSSDFAMFATDSLEVTREKLKSIKKMGKRTALIGRVDGLSEFIPSQKDMEAYNLPKIQQYKKKLDQHPTPEPIDTEASKKVSEEMKRLHANIVEMGILSVTGSGENNKIKRKCDEIVGATDDASRILKLATSLNSMENLESKLTEYNTMLHSMLKEKLLLMASEEILTVENIPESIRKRYYNDETKRNLITIYPKDNVWDAKKIRNFADKTEKIDSSITGTPIINLLFIDLMAEKGKAALLYGFIAVLVFLLIDFRSIKYTLIAIVPLTIGFIWLLGIMAVFDMDFTYASMMALPLIIGIGIDDGIHILHRYKTEGRGGLTHVVQYTGKAVLLTSLTTGIGFGSMGLASHKGFASMGQILFIGVWTCFISSVVVMPAIISIIEKARIKKGDSSHA